MIVLTFIGLLLIIVFAAYLLSRGAEVLAERWGCNIVGSVFLALLTTLPEYSFVYWASMKNQYKMAIGSAIGSCTLLITLGYGLVIILATSKMSRNPVKEIALSTATRIDALYLLITGIIAFLFVNSGDALTLWEGIVLSLLLLGYIFQVFRSSKHSSCKSGKQLSVRSMIRAGLELLVGGVIIYYCSEPFVDSMMHLAELVHVNPAVIAIVLGPIASEMPEKLTAYMVVLKNGKNAELAVCNFLGSKVNHNSLLLAVMPFVAHFKGHDIVTGIMSPTFAVMTVLTVFVSGLIARGRLQRWEGYLLVSAYIVAMVIAMNT